MTINVNKPQPIEKSADRETYKLSEEQARVVKSALTAGYGISPDTQVDGGALKVESLDPQIKNLTYGTNDFTIYPDLVAQGTVQARSTVEKYIQFAQHGRIGHRLFQPEIGIGDVNSPRLKQQTVNMKYIVDTRQQSFAMQAAATVANPVEVQERDAITTIGKTIEWAIFNGDADLTAEGKGQGLEFDGLPKLIDPRNKIDLRARQLSPEVLNQAAVLIAQGFGTATDAYMPVGVLADFSNQFLGAQRIVMPTPDGTTAGTNIDRFMSARGQINLKGSTVMDMDDLLDDSAPVNPQAPAQVAVTATVQADKGGQWLDELTDPKVVDGAGKPVVIRPAEINVEQSYKVVAVGAHGDSIPSEEVKATPANATDGVALTIKFAAMQAEIPDYVAIYRKGVKTGKYYLIGRVPTSEMGDDGVINFLDVDSRIPETANIFIGEMDPQVIALYQFIPLSRFDLATVTTATSFAIMWSGSLALMNPRRWVEISNVRYNLFADEQNLKGLNVWGYSK